MWDGLSKENLSFLLIDFQKQFFPILDEKIVKSVRSNILLLIRMFKKLEVPMIGTEHYRKGLGLTDQTVLDEWSGPPFTDKSTFSCCGDDRFLENLESTSRPIVAVSGLETHICVMQTVFDLLQRDYKVLVLIDAVLSTTKLKWQNGLELMKDAGAILTNTEALLFYLLKRIGTEEFNFMVKQLKQMQVENK